MYNKATKIETFLTYEEKETLPSTDLKEKQIYRGRDA